MSTIVLELRRALRSLARTPGLTAAAILTLALGTGSTMAIGTLIYSILWRPVPGVRSQNLAVVYPTDRGSLDTDSNELSLAEIEGLRASGAVEDIALLATRNLTLTGGEPERVPGASVSPGFFRLLGVPMLLGRGFQAQEGRSYNREEVAVLSYSIWQRRFGGDPAALGRTLEINRHALTVVGILPAGFGVPDDQQIYLPWAAEAGYDRASRDFWTIAALSSPAAARAAQPALDAATSRLHASGEIPDETRGFRLVPLREALHDPHALRLSVVLSSLVSLLLVVACFNVANLLLARAAARDGEVALRLALGAGRSRIVATVLAESFLLALAGCASGLALGKWGLDVAVATLHEAMPAWMSFSIDGRLVGANCALVAAVTLLAGLAPALGIGRSGLQPLLAATGRGDSRKTQRSQRWLVSLQFAGSYLVLAGGWWLLGSVRALDHAPLGFDPQPVLTLRTYLPGDAYDPDPAKIAFRKQLLARLAETPGVAAAGLTTSIPADDGGESERVSRAELAPTPETSEVISLVGVTRGFFDALGAPLAGGRLWTEAEDAGAPLAGVVVNRALAEKLWPGQQPLGRRLRLGLAADAPVYEVIGLAPLLPFEELHEQTARARLQVFVPFARFPWRTASLLVRAAGGDPANLTAGVTSAIHGLEPNAPVYDLLTYRARLRETWEDRRLIGQIASAFAVQGLLLAAVGLFGILAYAVARRRREIGLRMALGATPRVVVSAVVRDGLRVTTPGIVLGAALALAAARAVSGVLYGIDPLAPLPLVSALALLLALAAAASVLASRRASTIEPSTALRQD